MKSYCYTIIKSKYDIIISGYTTYKSAIQHISALNLTIQKDVPNVNFESDT